MMRVLVAVVDWGVVALLGIFLVRRYLLIVASSLPRRAAGRNTKRSIAILVSGRNEGAHVDALLDAIDHLDYPRQLVHVVLVSDGSTDDTAARMQAWSARRPQTSAVALGQSRGKGGALAVALEQAPPTDLVVVFDADSVPCPGVLQALSGAFDDARVGAATGYPSPGNACASLVARYAALERWTHHLVILAGKDRLGLNPSIIGVVFAVRRTALDQAGGFPVGRMSEDIDLAMALLNNGWTLRWVREAEVREDVVEHLGAFVAQRTRWGRGILQSAPAAHGIEQLFVVAGYLDRIVLVLAVALAAAGMLPLWIPAAYLLAPGMSALAALWQARQPNIPMFGVAAVVMLAADIAVSVASSLGQLVGTRVGWSAAPRSARSRSAFARPTSPANDD
ncbi:MAG: glycosyltransferase family 2 protein [Gemmatimonadaceae bacterium]|nr:glycosyltransferase family 2 protein [Gemmatimonadaceae bacterium]